MNGLHVIVESPGVQRMGMALLHSLWQIAIVGAVLFILLRALRRRDARARYAASCVGLLACMALPMLTFWLCEAPARPLPRESVAGQVSQPGAPLTTEGRFVPDVAFHRGAALTEPGAAIETPSIAMNSGPRLPDGPAFTARFVATLHGVVPWAVLVWGTGVLAMSLWNLGGWLALRQLRSDSSAPVPVGARQAAVRLCRRLRLSRPVGIVQSALAATPLVVGAFRPVIFLPASVLTELSMAELESILAHELAHVLRHDYVLNLVQSVIETLLFYHPAAWWISRQIRIERENCCDDVVLTVTRDRATYVTALAAVACVRAPALAAAASGGKLLPRLRRVLGIPEAEAGRSSRWLAGVLVAGCLVIGAVVPRLGPIASAADKTSPATQPADDDIVHVRGRVLDPDGKPAVGTKVHTAPNWWPGTPQGHPAIFSTVSTDAEGRFEISFSKSAASPFVLTYGRSGADLWKRMQITASADGLGMDWQTFDHVDGGGDVVLQLVHDVPLHGRVLDLEGRPVSGVGVSVSGLSSHILTEIAEFQHPPENYRGIEQPLAAIGRTDAIVSDADGRFTIGGLGQERRVTLDFLSDKVASSSIWVMTRDGKPIVKQTASDPGSKTTIYASTFDLSAGPARTISGMVRDAQTHEPLANVRVETSYSRIEVKSVTDAQGRYRLGGLERQQHIELTAQCDDRPYVPAIFDLPEKGGFEPIVRDIELTKGIWITGKVNDSVTGNPLPASVGYVPLASNKLAMGIALFKSGRASPVSPECNTQTRPDGTYRLIGVSGPGIVEVQMPDGQAYRRGQGFENVKSKDRAGHLATFFPAPMDPTFCQAIREIDAVPNATMESVDFSLERGGSIHIVCTDMDGKPVQNLIVFGSNSATSSNLPTHENSEFDSVGLQPKETRLVAVQNDERHLGKLTSIREASANGKPVTIKLEPMGIVRGRVVTPDGNPIKEARIRIDSYMPELLRSNRSGIAIGLTDSEGRFKIYVPTGGRYVLGASDNPHGGRFKFVNENMVVESGVTKDLGDIEVNPRAMMK